ncbi:MAG: hypothetical protein IJ805_01560 [Lachnospiraceae bacterium]|nr:hypothetical protein [Lachnospiraceae bacterium]
MAMDITGISLKNSVPLYSSGAKHNDHASSPLSSYASSLAAKNSDEKREESNSVRALIRKMNSKPKVDKDGKQVFTDTTKDKQNGFLQLSGTSQTDKSGTASKKSSYSYNYKEVANRIRRAKTAVGAGQAVLAARRKVFEVRRKIASGDGDANNLQLALTHARRMEMAARKKKHHIELEELVTETQKRDENADRLEKANEDMHTAMTDAAKEEIYKEEDRIFEERQAMLSEYTEAAREQATEAAEETLQKMNRLISDFGEEELKALEEMMEELENMEIVNPHMSKEELEELKRKHRNEENKAILRAEMDYLKGIFKYMQESGQGFSSSSVNPVSGISMSSFSVATPAAIDTGAGFSVNVTM